MKKIPLLIVVPLIAVLVVVVVGMLVKVSSPAPASQTQTVNKSEFPNPVKDTEVTKPSTFLGGLFGQNPATPTPTPVTSAELSTELKSTYDDGGQSDIDALQKEAESL